jgi:hypothetical protein
VWAVAAGVAVGAIAANPYVVLRPRNLWTENIALVGQSRPGSVAGYDFRWAVAVWGWPLAVMLAAALACAVRWKDTPSRLLFGATAIFCGLLLFCSVRPYWYNAILPAGLLLVARLVGSAARRVATATQVDEGALAALVAVALVALPLTRAVAEAREAWVPRPSLERRADRAAQRWIESNVPAESRLLMVGYYAMNLPRLVAHTNAAHGRWAEHFMYGRDQNAGWVDAFRRAYRRHRGTGQPSYEIVNVRRNYGNQDADPQRNRRMDTELADLARLEGARYLVTASPQRFRGRWESDPGVRLLALFGPASGHTGDEVKVFEVAPAGSAP